MEQYEKKIANVEVGDLVTAKHCGCNMSAEEGIVVKNDADICIIDTCKTAQVYESNNGLRAHPREEPICVYVFGGIEPTDHSRGVVVTKI